MTQKVIRLGTEPNNMLATLEDLTQWVQDNKIAAMAIVAVDKGSTVLTALFAEDKIFTLLGGVHNVANTIDAKIDK